MILGFKQLSWKSVRIPQIMPKPDLMPLTGGYRRTPVMQIGADIFCDTQIIIREIERRSPSPTLFPPGAAGVAWALGSWTDAHSFRTRSISCLELSVEGAAGIIEDRSHCAAASSILTRCGRRSADAQSDPRPARLDQAQLGDGRKWLLGDFSLADVSAYMNVG